MNMDESYINRLQAENESLVSEIKRLNSLINSPQTDSFLEAVRIESAHQVERWGSEHDGGKRPEDWIALVTYLLGKAAKAHFDNDHSKLVHHIITIAAVCNNRHSNATGTNTKMRPGILR